MQRNVVRFAAAVSIVLVAMAAGIGLGFGRYYLFQPAYGIAQQSVPESPSTLRRGLD